MTIPDREIPEPVALDRTLRKITEVLAQELACPTQAVPDWSDFEWIMARAVAAMHGVSPLLSRALRWQGPAGWTRFLEEQRAHTATRHARIAELLLRLDQRAREAGVAAVALKGVALHAFGVYQAGERPMADVDLLVGSLGKARSMDAPFPRPAHPAMDHFASDAPGNHARSTRGVRAGKMTRQLNVGTRSALGKVAVRKQRLKCVGSLRRMAAPAQIKPGSGGNALPECGPSRLIDRVRLAFFKSRNSLATTQWCQQGTPARRLGGNEYDTGDFQRTCGEAKFRAPQINLELLHAAAAADNGRSADQRRTGSRKGVQRIAAYVQKIRNSRREHRIRRHKYAVLRQEIHAAQQTVQGGGRLSGAAITEQEKSATISSDTCPVQRHQSLSARREREHREFDEFVTGVVWEPEHVSRKNDERRSVIAGQHGKVRRARRSAQQPGSGEHLYSRRIGLGSATSAGCEPDSDADARRDFGEFVPRQAGIRPIHQATQLRASAFKLERAAEQMHPCAGHRGRLFVERIGRDVSRANFVGAHEKLWVMQQ
jgi:hypothetical protein